MPLTRRTRGLVTAVGFAVSVLVGCGGAGSLVERGDRIQTGKERFDGYFGEVIELHAKVKELDSDLFPLRQPLTEGLGIGADTPLPKLMAEVRERVERFRSFGVSASLRTSPNPSVVLHKGELGQEESDDVTLKAIQESAVRSLATYREYAELLQRATRLDDQRVKLMEQLERPSSEIADRSGVEAEILGAGRLLQEVQTKLLKDMRTCALLLVALGEAVETGANEARDAACDEALAHHRPSKQSLPRSKRWGSGGWTTGSSSVPPARPVTPSRSSPAPAAPSAPSAAPSRPASPPKKGTGDFDM
ncbi:MAG: hypothetical protein FJ096_06785 [Deltaproteobacteria bacterium]|nr:hypothetical protein [Deltaproteobacteria bacterium]